MIHEFSRRLFDRLTRRFVGRNARRSAFRFSRRSAYRCLTALGLATWAGGVPATAFAQRTLTDIPSTDPEVERQALEVCDGFEVTLFAADPLLAKPIQINFDAAGRLWAATSSTYPQIKPGDEANDKIIVLEDADGDGKADKTTVFADGLLIPTGLEPGLGGCFVANSTELLFLADSDGDGKADVRRTVLSGFGTEDTHHIIHTFRWGPDGALYFNQSVYIHSHVETPYGVRRLGAGGIWQFRPDTERLEVLCRGMWNSWGHHFDRFGQSFATDGAGSQGIHYIIPGATYAAVPNTRRPFTGLNERHPKYSGAEIVESRHLPDDWQGNILTHDFRGNRVCRFSIQEDGAGYAVKQEADVIKTRFVAFRPIDVKQGPDGAIYIADWYNPIIQHGEVDFRDPRRDHTHGRIWRVTAKNRPLVPRPKLTEATTAELLAAAEAPENWTRHFARRVLVDRAAVPGPAGKAAQAEIRAAVAAASARVEAAGQPELELLWTSQALGIVDESLLGKVLAATDGRVRAGAVRVLSAWREALPQADRLLAERVADEHPRVRLEAVRGLGGSDDVQAVASALSVLDRNPDRFAEHALYLTTNELAPKWIPALKEGRTDLGGKPHQVEYALSAVASPEIVAAIVELLQRPGLEPVQRQNLLRLLATLGGPVELERVYRAALAENDPAATATLLGLLVQSATQRKVLPAGDLQELAGLIEASPEGVRTEAIRLAGAKKLPAALALLQKLATNAQEPLALREEALISLAKFGGDGRTFLDKTVREGTDRTLRIKAAQVLAGVDPKAAAGRIVELLQASGDAPEAAGDLVLALVRQQQGPGLLVRELQGKKLPADVGKLAVRLVRANLKEPAKLEEAIRTAAGLGAGAKPLTDEQRRELVAAVMTKGNAARGEKIFRRNELSCLKCHALGGAGGQVGPEMSSIGGSAQIDYLLDSLYDPNKAIKENYHSVVVNTVDGKALTGIKVRDNKQVLVLRDAEDREIVIPIDEIEEQAPGKSLMPAGLVEPLTTAEVVDLVRYLSELGKVGNYALPRGQFARTWQVLENNQDGRSLTVPVLTAPVAQVDTRLTWTNRYANVNGSLPLDELPVLGQGPIAEKGPARLVRCRFEASAAGKLSLDAGPTEGLEVWIDGVPAAIEEGCFTATVQPGTRTVTVRLLATRNQPFAVRLDEERTGAKGMWVTGK